LYNTAKKKSNCAEIMTIIEENAVSKTPYVYSFAIIDKNNIEDKLSYYLMKISYDFISRHTKIEYARDLNGENKLFDNLRLAYNRKLFLHSHEGKLDNDDKVFAKNGEGIKIQQKIMSIITYDITIENYNDIINDIDIKIINIFRDLNIDSYDDFIYTKFTDNLQIHKVSIDNLHNLEPDNIKEINKNLDLIKQEIEGLFNQLLDYLGLQLNYPLDSIDNFFAMKEKAVTNDSNVFGYFDLQTMEIKTIDYVNINDFNNDFFKIVCIDKYNNIYKTYTSMKLLDFTRYFANVNISPSENYEALYSDTIIYNILYANKNKDKISL
tara:strand:+ start:3278 stop:4249 length:972 start_codon:yes stop_codon:yes gene_type:complete